MKKGKIYWYIIKRNVGLMLLAMTVYLVVVSLMNLLLGVENNSSVSTMSVVMIFIFASCNTDENILHFSSISASRKLLFKVQLTGDLIIAALVSLLFGVLSVIATHDLGSLSFLQIVKSDHIFNWGGGMELAMVYFCLVILVESILIFDGFRKEPLFTGMFSARKTTHPYKGTLLYIAIVVVVGVSFAALEDIESFTMRVLVYGILLAIAAGFYYGARRLSTKKEF